MAMEYRTLGNTGLNASVIGFGCSRIAQTPSPERRREVVATLEEAFDRGINLFDTANSYDDDERLLGSVFRKRRDSVILCSKAGYRSWLLLALEKAAPRWSGPILRLRPMRRAGSRGRAGPRKSRRNFDPRCLRLGVEGSLRRLGTDYLDIFYLHSPPPDVLADDAVFRTLEELQNKGWLRHYGISFSERATTDQVLAGLERPGVSVLQVKANALESVDLERIASRAKRRGIAVIARQLFDRGAVFGATELLRMLAEQTQRTPAQTLLRSVLQRCGVDVVLVGMTTRQHLDENLKALSVPPLSADELERFLAATRIT
jgi:aryl-alcohol dehydrogenase-like predicted oxidoreductase